MYGGIANEAMVDRFIRQLPLMMRTPADATHHLALLGVIRLHGRVNYAA
jgi:hypothetical protein